MKLLRINKQDPSKTTYMHPKEVESYFWGRRVDNYILIVLDENKKVSTTIDPTWNVTELQELINAYFNLGE